MSYTGNKKANNGKNARSKKAGSKSLWGGIIEYDEPPPSAQVESIRSAIDVGLGRFEQHKTNMISILRDAHTRGGRIEPFDEVTYWTCLTRLAQSFFWQAQRKLILKTPPAAERKRRLDELARALKQSRTIIDAAMQNDVGDRLFSSWCEGTNEPLVSVRNVDGSLAAVRGPEEAFKNAVASLRRLEAAALAAASTVQLPGRGRQRGTAVLPAGYIEVLVTLYREAAGEKAGAGSGPFVKFVGAFLAATGSANISEEYVAELAQAALSSARIHTGGSALSSAGGFDPPVDAT